MRVNHERGGLDCGVPCDRARVVGAAFALPRVQRPRREVADGPRIAAVSRVPRRGCAARPRSLQRGAARGTSNRTASALLTNNGCQAMPAVESTSRKTILVCEDDEQLRM